MLGGNSDRSCINENRIQETAKNRASCTKSLSHIGPFLSSLPSLTTNVLPAEFIYHYLMQPCTSTKPLLSSHKFVNMFEIEPQKYQNLTSNITQLTACRHAQTARVSMKSSTTILALARALHLILHFRIARPIDVYSIKLIRLG